MLNKFIIKQRNWSHPPCWIRHFELIKPLINQGNRDGAVDLRMEGSMLGRENKQVMKLREK